MSTGALFPLKHQNMIEKFEILLSLHLVQVTCSMPNLNSGHPKLSLKQAAEQVNLQNTSSDKCCRFKEGLVNRPPAHCIIYCNHNQRNLLDNKMIIGNSLFCLKGLYMLLGAWEYKNQVYLAVSTNFYFHQHQPQHKR